MKKYKITYNYNNIEHSDIIIASSYTENNDKTLVIFFNYTEVKAYIPNYIKIIEI